MLPIKLRTSALSEKTVIVGTEQSIPPEGEKGMGWRKGKCKERREKDEEKEEQRTERGKRDLVERKREG